MMETLIVSGGSVTKEFLNQILAQHHFDDIIAVDKGMELFWKSEIKPNLILGDFDSAKPEVLRFFQEETKVPIMAYPPEKDETDTELALRIAIERNATKITLIGVTGTRMDHSLGAIQLLGYGMERDVECFLLDEHNRIRLAWTDVKIAKSEQYGTYVSLIPFSPLVRKVTTKGMKYPLVAEDLPCFIVRGVSNEIVDEIGEISFEEGLLLVIESKD